MQASSKSTFAMPQGDNAIYFSIIYSLIKICIICYGFLLVCVFYAFVSNIKVKYHYFSKIKQIKSILIFFF